MTNTSPTAPRRIRFLAVAALAVVTGLVGTGCSGAPVEQDSGGGAAQAAECVSDDECSGGFCSADGRCEAECSTNDECAPGEHCSASGVCQSTLEVPNQPSGNACAPSLAPISETVEVEVPVETIEEVVVTTEVSVTPTVMLLVDRSGSMAWKVDKNREDAPSGESRWDVVNEALFNAGDGLVKQLENDVAFGLVHYTDGGSSADTCVGFSQELDQLAFATGNYDNLAQLAGGLSPKSHGQTPTGESLEHAAAMLSSTTSEGQKHLILVTDGMPDTCDHPNADLDFGSAEHEAAKKLVVDAAGEGALSNVTVHVIGIGPDGTSTHFEEVATAGGGVFASARTDSGVYTAFASVLEDIRTETHVEEKTVTSIETRTETQLTCRLDISFANGADAARFATDGIVSTGGQEVDGALWRLNADGELELLGDACGEYLASGEAVTAALGCALEPVR